MKPQSKTIAFRLHHVLEERLAAEAAERQVSVGELARQIVIEHLASDQKKIAEIVGGIASSVERLDRELRRIALELLVNAGRAEPEEALSWIRTKLGPVDP